MTFGTRKCIAQNITKTALWGLLGIITIGTFMQICVSKDEINLGMSKRYHTVAIGDKCVLVNTDGSKYVN